MGLTFKENCPDIRNSKVVDLVSELEGYNCQVDVYDPWADIKRAESEYNLTLIKKPELGKYDAIVLAVAHQEFRELSAEEVKSYGKDESIIFDIKFLFEESEVDGRL